MKTQSLILALAHEMKRRHPKRRAPRCCHYERRQPIDLRYDAGFHPQGPPASGTPAPLSLSASTNPSPWSSPFADSAPGGVEAFEEETELDEPTAWGTGELEEDSGDPAQGDNGYSVARSDSTDDVVPVWGTGELESESEPQPAPAPAPEAEPAPAAPAASDRDSGSQVQPGLVGEQSTSRVPAPRALPNATRDDDPDTAAFQADLAAILSGSKSHPSTTGSAAPADAAEDPDESAPPAAPAPAPQRAQEFSHDVFERMGHPLSTAQTFNLGSFALQRQLDAFDREIERTERSGARRRPAAAPSPIARAASQSIDIRHDVPLVPQLTGMSCWAAGCAMIVGWRESMSIDPSEIARATGAWAQYHAGLEPENASIFPVWGLTPEPAQSYSVEGFVDLLVRYGPLWVASAEPGPHIRVVTGAVGDGTPDGTTLFINDPWEQGMTTFRLPNAGSRTTETYAQFVRKQESLARAESRVQGIYVARNARPRA